LSTDAAEDVEHVTPGVSFDVEEFAVLADGRRLWLNDDRSDKRGFSSFLHTPAGFEPVDFWMYATLDMIETDVLNTVLPDDDDTEDEHPWEWLAERIRAHGVEVTPEQLKALPYNVEFSERLRARTRTQ
jgi:hypothetical protein